MPKSAVPDDFEQLKVSFIDPIQHDYEAIRPVVLGADTLSARSHQVQIDRTVLGDKARRFLAQGVDVPLHMCGIQAYGGAESEPPISQNERTRCAGTTERFCPFGDWRIVCRVSSYTGCSFYYQPWA